MKLRGLDKRVKIVESWLEENDTHFEGVYRAYHGSFKIHWLKFEALAFLNVCLYLLGLVKLDFKYWRESELVENTKKYIRKNTLVHKILEEAINNELPFNELRDGKIRWINIDPFIVPYCGYYMFFRTTLECLIKYLKEKRFKLPYYRCIEPWEGVAEYFIWSLNIKKMSKTRRK